MSKLIYLKDALKTLVSVDVEGLQVGDDELAVNCGLFFTEEEYKAVRFDGSKMSKEGKENLRSEAGICNFPQQYKVKDSRLMHFNSSFDPLKLLGLISEDTIFLPYVNPQCNSIISALNDLIEVNSPPEKKIKLEVEVEELRKYINKPIYNRVNPMDGRTIEEHVLEAVVKAEDHLKSWATNEFELQQMQKVFYSKWGKRYKLNIKTANLETEMVADIKHTLDLLGSHKTRRNSSAAWYLRSILSACCGSTSVRALAKLLGCSRYIVISELRIFQEYLMK